MKHSLKELVQVEWATVEQIWEVLDKIPDDHPAGNHKRNVHALFKKDGTLKAKALAPQTSEDYQLMHTTSVFIRKSLRNMVEMERRKQRIEMIKQNIQDMKEGKDDLRPVSQDLQYGESRKEKMRRLHKERKHERQDE